MYTDICVHSTQPNMQSMEQLGGLGACPPLKNKCSEVNFVIKITRSKLLRESSSCHVTCVQ